MSTESERRALVAATVASTREMVDRVRERRVLMPKRLPKRARGADNDVRPDHVVDATPAVCVGPLSFEGPTPAELEAWCDEYRLWATQHPDLKL